MTHMYYESTRDSNIKINSANAILKGLSDDGGLFVMKSLSDKKIDIKNLINKDYYEMGIEITKIFLPDFTENEIKNCIYNAYSNKFETNKLVPIKNLKNAYIAELFNGPTSAFKDFGLLLLSQFMKTSLIKTNSKQDILILTATSGDTGKAALEGFKDVDRIKVMVFYPNDGVSKVQELQMKTQEGKNLYVASINGNFDDAQSGIKKIFTDEKFKNKLKKYNLTLSSANSINIGRLIPQILYYFYVYIQLVKTSQINLYDKINFVVPTGNFGNILAGYMAKKIGLPIDKLICASNENNVLYDFINTGIYDKNREFKKTISPSMDILISSNLERLLYYICDEDTNYINKLMHNLNKYGKFSIEKKYLEKIQSEFISGFATDDETKKIINKIYNEKQYLLDTHTAVAYKVFLDNNFENKTVILQTASPYKFVKDVYSSIFTDKIENELELMNKLFEKTNINIPNNLKNLNQKEIRFNDIIEKDKIDEYIIKIIGEKYDNN